MTALLWFAGLLPVVLGVLGLVRLRHGPVLPMVLRPWAVGSAAAVAGTFWAIRWLKYFGSVIGESRDPSQTVTFVIDGAVDPPPLGVMALVLLAAALAVGVRLRARRLVSRT